MILRYQHNDAITDFISSDDAIYHFTKKEPALEKIWRRQEIMFGAFGGANDPHEYKPRMTSAVGWAWDDELEKELPEITRLIDHKIKSSGFLSFCQNRYENQKIIEQGCLKSRMWSQYGQNHSGICFIFSKKNLLAEVKNRFSNNHLIFNNNVDYRHLNSSRVRDSLSINGGDLEQSSIDEIAITHLEANNESIFFKKTPDYQDENEFRLVVVSKDRDSRHGHLVDVSSSLKVVILGDAFPEVYLPTVRNLSEKTLVPFRKLHWEKGEYFLFTMNKNNR